MDSINIHVYGWGENIISNHWVQRKVQKEVPIFNLGTQDCTLRWTSPASANPEKTILHRRFNEECGLLEHFMSTTYEPSIVTMSNSNNHVVYTTPRGSLWSFNSRKEAISTPSFDPESLNSDVSESIQLYDIAEPKVVSAPVSDTASAAVPGLVSGRQAGQKSLYRNYKHTLITFERVILQIAAGESHCLVITDGNFLFSFGTGSCGELGIESTPTYANTLQLVRFPNNDGVKYIAAGSYYSAAISVAGILYTFGCGAYYRLGHGTDENCNVPRKVEALEGVGMPGPHGTSSGISLVACGVWHTVAIASDTHDVYCWGWNKHGQCGVRRAVDLPVDSLNIPVDHAKQDRTGDSADSGHVCEALSEPRRVLELDDSDLIGDHDISAVSCGSRHTALLTAHNTRIIIMGMLGSTDSCSDRNSLHCVLPTDAAATTPAPHPIPDPITSSHSSSSSSASSSSSDSKQTNHTNTAGNDRINPSNKHIGRQLSCARLLYDCNWNSIGQLVSNINKNRDKNNEIGGLDDDNDHNTQRCGTPVYDTLNNTALSSCSFDIAGKRKRCAGEHSDAVLSTDDIPHKQEDKISDAVDCKLRCTRSVICSMASTLWGLGFVERVEERQQ